jgi:hypothetical protein
MPERRDQLNGFGTMERGIGEVENCGRVDTLCGSYLVFLGHIFVLFLYFDIENIYSRKTSECLASNVDFIQIPLAFSFLVSIPFFSSSPFSHTVLSSSVDHPRL